MTTSAKGRGSAIPSPIRPAARATMTAARAVVGRCEHQRAGNCRLRRAPPCVPLATRVVPGFLHLGDTLLHLGEAFLEVGDLLLEERESRCVFKCAVHKLEISYCAVSLAACPGPLCTVELSIGGKFRRLVDTEQL